VRDNRNVLGRAVDCDIVLSVPEVSRHHALIVRRAGQVLLSDLGSANGSAVNGVLVGKEPEVIVAGDRLRFGETELSLRPV
jgi:pSer/pThr/pTyr-binding forkhead associated (FHA) protein